MFLFLAAVAIATNKSGAGDAHLVNASVLLSGYLGAVVRDSTSSERPKPETRSRLDTGKNPSFVPQNRHEGRGYLTLFTAAQPLITPLRNPRM